MRAAALLLALVWAGTTTPRAAAQEPAAAGGAAVAQEVSAVLLLDEARARAESRALGVALARWDHEAARGDVARWTGAALPRVAGFVDLSAGGGWTSAGLSRPASNQAAVGARGSVRLFDPAAWAAAAAARRSLRGEAATVDWAKVRVRQQATELFATVRLEQDVALALEEARRSAEEDAVAVESLVAAGLRPQADAARTRAEAMDLGARAVEARGRQVAACAALQDLMAVTIDGACRLAALPDAAEPEDAAAGSHPALVAAEEAVAAARAARASAVGAQLPTITADGSAGHYEVPGGGGPGWGVGLGLEVPLRVATEGRGELISAAADRGAAAESLAGQRRSLDAARIGAEAQWQASTASVLAREGAVQASDAALRLVQERYRAGLADVSALLDARRAGVDAQVGLLRAGARRWSALAALEAARGVH